MISAIFLGFLLFTSLSAAPNRQYAESNGKISVMLSERNPFVFFNENGTPVGLDISIIENFAQKFHLRIDYIVINSSLNEIFSNEKNFNASSILNDIKEADVIIGALDENLLTNKHLIASHAYYHDALTWCVQQKQPIASWKNLFRLVRDPAVYILFTIGVFAILFTGYFLQQFEKSQSKWDWNRIVLVAFSAFFGFCSEYRPTCLSSRVYFAFCILGGMLFALSVPPILLKIVGTKLFDHQIESRQEIVNGSFDLFGDSFAFQQLKKEIYPLHMIENFKICKDFDVCLSQLDENPKTAVIISRERIRTMHQASQYYCFGRSEIIYEYALTFLVQKHFLYLNELNWFIQTSRASGLIEKWRSESHARVKNVHEETNYRQLRLRNAYGFGIIYCSYNIIIIVLLFFERYVYRKAREPNPVRIWLLIEMLIDSDRHFWLDTKLI